MQESKEWKFGKHRTKKNTVLQRQKEKCQDFKISVQVFSIPAVLDGTPFHKTNGL